MQKKTAISISALIIAMCLNLGVSAQSSIKIPNEKQLEKLSIKDLTNHIRREKFDKILPQVMKEQGIDMWIHVMRTPVSHSFNDVGHGFYDELGSRTGVFVFTDRGYGRIERAALGRRRLEIDFRSLMEEGADIEELMSMDESQMPDPIKECGAYDIITPPFMMNEEPGGKETEYDFRFEDFGEFVAERDPRRIAVNYEDELGPTVCAESNDGISHTDFNLLSRAIGKKYADRIVSSEHLIINYISRPVPSEIVMIKRIRNWIAESQKRDFASIVSGKTKITDLESETSVMFPGGRGPYDEDLILKPGQLFILDQGAEAEYDLRDQGSQWQFGNFFDLIVQYGYILKEGEVDLPPEIKKIWEDSQRIREITAANIKVGRTGKENFDIIKAELDKAGFIVTPAQGFHEDLDPSKTQVSIDLHALGKGRNAPRIGSIGPDWEHEIPIPNNHHFMMEFFIFRASPSKMGGQDAHHIWFHDGAIATESGVEYLTPPPTEITLIK
jgi:hypothetical protein